MLNISLFFSCNVLVPCRPAQTPNSSKGLKKKSEIKSIEESKSNFSVGHALFQEGQCVQIRYQGRGPGQEGSILRVRSNKTVDVYFADGKLGERIPFENVIILKTRATSHISKLELKIGLRILARYRRRSKFYPGKIVRVREDGTFDIDYDDGEKETRVKEEFIRALEKPVRASSASRSRLDDVESDVEKDEIVEGTKVEARYKGRSKYYPGRISRVRLNGTFDIDYDDGEKETGVTKDLIRLLEKSSKSRSRVVDDGVMRFEEGMKVEGQYKGRSKFYPGKIVRVREDGTFDIDYDDGEKETRVKEEFIRALEKPPRMGMVSAGRLYRSLSDID